MVELILTIISIIGLIGYNVNIPALTYIAAIISLLVDIILLMLPFYRKSNIAVFIIAPALGYMINHSLLGVAYGICIVDVIVFIIWRLVSLILYLFRKGAHKRKKQGSDELFCTKCGFTIKHNESVCPNCGSPFEEDK